MRRGLPRSAYDNRARYEAARALAQRIRITTRVYTLDEIADGSTYARPLAAALSSGKLNLASTNGLAGELDGGLIAPLSIRDAQVASDAAIEGSKLDVNLDDVADGTNYAKVLGKALDTGKLKMDSGADGISGKLPGSGLSEGSGPLSHLSSTGALDNLTSVTTKSLDSLDEGTTYKRVIAAAVNSGKLKLDSGVDGISGKLPGSSLAEGSGPLTNLTSAGALDSLTHVTTRSLDDVTDGATYAKPLAAALSSGKLNIAAGAAGIAGQLPAAQLADGAVVAAKIGQGAVAPHHLFLEDNRASLIGNSTFGAWTRG